MIALILVWGLASGQKFAGASECVNPNEARDLAACFSGPRPAYMVALKYSGLSASSTSTAIENACKDFDETDFQQERSLLGTAANVLGDMLKPVFQDIPTVVETMLGGNQAVTDYKNRLAVIGRIKDRFVRIRKVYELVVESQGTYDKEDNHTLMTPGIILGRAKAGKPSGVCRDFAKLLEWSLLAVNRSPALSEELKNWGGLDEDSFMVTQVFDVGSRHAWVEVLLPVGVGDAQVFHKMDLDTTFYKAYSPLYQRRTGPSERGLDALRTECRAVADCVQKLVVKYLPTSKLNSSAVGFCSGH